MTTNQYAQGVPILNAPYFQVNGLEVTVASNTTLSVNTGLCRDSTNSFDMTVNTALSINAALNGAGGLDTGTFAASTPYFVHIISSPINPVQVAAMISLSQTAPVLPAGYSIWRWVGWELSDGSTHFLARYVMGDGSYRKHFWDAPISVLSGGTATSATAIDLSGAMVTDTFHSNILPAYFDASYTPETANDKVTLVPGGSSSTTGASLSGVVAAKVQTGQLTVPSVIVSGVPKIAYINSAASGSTTLLLQGFDYYL